MPLSPSVRHADSSVGLLEPAEKLTDATALAGPLISAGSMFAFFAAHQADVFRDADYADLLGARPSKARRGQRAGQRVVSDRTYAQ